MSARRAARAPRAAVVVADIVDNLPTALAIGCCVEVWAPENRHRRRTPLPGSGTRSGRAQVKLFEAARERYNAALLPFVPRHPNRHDRGPVAWSIDGRRQAPFRLRPVEPRGTIDGPAMLRAAGLDDTDLERLRSEAEDLVLGPSGGGA